ncbi:alcohol dehydrogenase catalytic domain-containing protein [Microbispora sp. GKU 823]|uniref:alcohol dehydrogenase catalytic domain-containing protein n=1 Tax=Microbispora sp. GKU 823 TaxID=1652100 RepID=UPI002117E5C8|nr:alcohol dehydrogenase catalytic domain-containing protein [Microbispora sp. GKU 823]
MRTTTGWMSTGGATALRRVRVERRDLRDDDLAVRVDYCGVCHSDLHRIGGLLGEGALVPGHEFTGTVTAVGVAVTEFSVGDRVAVGTVVDSCGVCEMCRIGQENFCYEGPVTTYGGTDRVDGTRTQGGYSREYVVRDRFAYHLPDGLDQAAAAPLMCAGSPSGSPCARPGSGPGAGSPWPASAGWGTWGEAGPPSGRRGHRPQPHIRQGADAHKLGAVDILVPPTDSTGRLSGHAAGSTSSWTPSPSRTTCPRCCAWRPWTAPSPCSATPWSRRCGSSTWFRAARS